MALEAAGRAIGIRAFLQRPQTVGLRRALFQVHLWVGVAAGVYVFVVCATGAALVFRIDMQRAAYPELFTPGPGAPADAATILERVGEQFPGWRVSGLDAPTTSRPTYLAYVANDATFRTLLVDPVSARVLGELPERGVIRTLQLLHFDLLGGRRGRMVNGIGGLLLLVLCLTGLVIWWQGSANWRRGLTVDFSRGWKRVNWELHSAVGIWSVAFVAMWAVTGVYFAFPSQFRATVNALSPLTVSVTPRSGPPPGRHGAPDARELIARAMRQVPAQHVARVVPPFDETAAFLVMFSRETPYTPGAADLTSVYLDRHTGAVLTPPARGARSAGDIVMDWVVPLHIGNFSGLGVKMVWFVFGLAPPVLFLTAFVMWWTRVVRRRFLTII